MKTLIGLMMVVGFSAFAQPNYISTPQLNGLDYGATNSFVVGVSGSSLALQVSFYGDGARTTVGKVGIVSNPSAGAALGINLDGAWTVYQWSDTATNANEVKTAASSGAAATNLLTKLTADFPGLVSTYAASNIVSLATAAHQPFTLTNSATWATNDITTNAIAGGLSFIVSNSLDRVAWFSDSGKNFTLAYNSTNPVSLLTNWSSLGPIGYWKFTVVNSSTNYAVPQGLQIVTGTKPGL